MKKKILCVSFVIVVKGRLVWDEFKLCSKTIAVLCELTKP